MAALDLIWVTGFTATAALAPELVASAITLYSVFSGTAYACT